MVAFLDELATGDHRRFHKLKGLYRFAPGALGSKVIGHRLELDFKDFKPPLFQEFLPWRMRSRDYHGRPSKSFIFSSINLTSPNQPVHRQIVPDRQLPGWREVLDELVVLAK
jgi:hypothetical protein